MYILHSVEFLLLYVLSYSLSRIHSFKINFVISKTYSTIPRYANPVTSEGSNYGKFTSEEDAFLWFDEALLYVRAGSGGAGSSAVKFGAGRQHRYPTGGSGGNGGNVYLVADSNVNTLLHFRGSSHYKAENGVDGALEYCNGRNGKDTYISVPRGLIVKDNSTNEVLGELNYIGDKLLVCKGGLGGKGNAAYKSSLDKSIASPPQGGQKKWLKIELKLVADVGLVGLPNAGKSTLLDAITNARPKIASYAFTTIVPNLGVCEVNTYTDHLGQKNIKQSSSSTPSSSPTTTNTHTTNTKTNNNSNSNGNNANSSNNSNNNSYDRMVIADIPGLIEGAHSGKGLGKGFLRHVERCKILIHLIDGQSKDPVKDYTIINQELQLFSTILANKPQIVVINKIDIPEVAEKLDSILFQINQIMPHKRLLTISAASRLNTEELIQRTYMFLQKIINDEKEVAATNANASSSSSSSSTISYMNNKKNRNNNDNINNMKRRREEESILPVVVDEETYMREILIRDDY